MNISQAQAKCERCFNRSIGLHHRTNLYLCQPCWEAADDANPFEVEAVHRHIYAATLEDATLACQQREAEIAAQAKRERDELMAATCRLLGHEPVIAPGVYVAGSAHSGDLGYNKVGPVEWPVPCTLVVYSHGEVAVVPLSHLPNVNDK